MSNTTYVDYTTPAVNAEWLNEVNDHIWSDTYVSTRPAVHDSTKIGFTSTGTGAAVSNTQAKLRERVSVEDFFLASDTDATAMIQRALNSGAKLVECGQGATYIISSTLTVPAGIYIDGRFSTFTTSTIIQVLDFVNGGGVKDLIITGPGGTTYAAGSSGIICRGTNNAPAAPTYVTGPTIEGCTISGFGEYGIFLEYVKSSKIISNKISLLGYAGIGGCSCEDVIVYGNTISDITAGSAGGDAYGVFIDRNNGNSETAEPRSYRCIISKNIIKNVSATSADNGHGIDTHAGVEFVIDGNEVINCEAGIFLTASTISGTQQLAPRRCVVSNNIITGGHSSYGIIVYGARNGSVVAEEATDCVVTGNIVTGHGTKTSGTIPGVFFSATKNIVCTGNIFKQCGGSCLMLDFQNLWFNISGNMFIDPQSTTYAQATCILVYGNDNRGYIGNNSYCYENSVVATYVAVNSIRIEATLTGIDIDFGRSTFQGIDATHLTFSPQTTTGVRYAGLVEMNAGGTIAVASGVGDGITDVVFAKRFPYVPRVTVSLRYPYNGGGKFPIIGVDTVTTITAAGFRIYAKPYDGTTWTASGSLSFEWLAN